MQHKAQYREEDDDRGLRMWSRVLFRGKENVGIGKIDKEGPVNGVSALAHVRSWVQYTEMFPFRFVC